jgi:hypothetical protein
MWMGHSLPTTKTPTLVHAFNEENTQYEISKQKRDDIEANIAHSPS